MMEVPECMKTVRKAHVSVSHITSAWVTLRHILTEKVCRKSGTRLLAFGTLAGGLLTDRWLGKPEPTEEQRRAAWSLMKYHRFVVCFGGLVSRRAIVCLQCKLPAKFIASALD